MSCLVVGVVRNGSEWLLRWLDVRSLDWHKLQLASSPNVQGKLPATLGLRNAGCMTRRHTSASFIING